MTGIPRMTRLDRVALASAGLLVVLIVLAIAAGSLSSPLDRGRRAGERPSRVVYISAQGGQRELWTVGLDDQPPEPLTQTGGRVYDFAAAPDGKQVAYTVLNESQGVDLWLVDRSGRSPRRLLECGSSRCTAPAWSPDGKQIAYSREAASLTPNSGPGAPRPWLVEVPTANTRPLFQDGQIIGYGASWSPDGRRLVSYDGISGGLRVAELATGKFEFLPANTGALGAWSPDSRYLLYTRVEEIDAGFRTVILRTDFNSGETSVFLGNDDQRDHAYALPAWSPDGKYLLVGLQNEPGNPARQVWQIQPDLIEGPVIAGEADYTYSLYQWRADGGAVAMQRSRLGTVSGPEVLVWTADGGLKVLAENAMLPQWLP